jgi:hypothetical protein
MLDDIGVEENVEHSFCTFQYLVHAIPVTAKKTVLNFIKAILNPFMCSAWLCTNAIIFIIIICENLILDNS